MNPMPFTQRYTNKQGLSVCSSPFILPSPKSFLHLQEEPLAPFYAERSLRNYPTATPLDGFTAGLDALARTLPPGSPAMPFCLRRISERCLALVGDPKAALGLVHLLAYLLLVVDLQVLPPPPGWAPPGEKVFNKPADLSETCRSSPSPGPPPTRPGGTSQDQICMRLQPFASFRSICIVLCSCDMTSNSHTPPFSPYLISAPVLLLETKTDQNYEARHFSALQSNL